MLKLRSDDVKKSTQSKFLVHTMQILPHKYCKSLETQKILPVSTENETVHYFRVQVSIINAFRKAVMLFVLIAFVAS